MPDVRDLWTAIQVERPFCPQCQLPMQFSHLEPTMVTGREHFIYRCSCGEVLDKISVRESEHE